MSTPVVNIAGADDKYKVPIAAPTIYRICTYHLKYNLVENFMSHDSLKWMWRQLTYGKRLPIRKTLSNEPEQRSEIITQQIGS